MPQPGPLPYRKSGPGVLRLRVMVKRSTFARLANTGGRERESENNGVVLHALAPTAQARRW